ncbi:MAG: hypothetical protein JW727_04885 [Candidatus Aenigmarchaeota archaeon]|nr:hypothetical protein [Candidatus Aenigmarchaeota archaeon]
MGKISNHINYLPTALLALVGAGVVAYLSDGVTASDALYTALGVGAGAHVGAYLGGDNKYPEPYQSRPASSKE